MDNNVQDSVFSRLRRLFIFQSHAHNTPIIRKKNSRNKRGNVDDIAIIIVLDMKGEIFNKEFPANLLLPAQR